MNDYSSPEGSAAGVPGAPGSVEGAKAPDELVLATAMEEVLEAQADLQVGIGIFRLNGDGERLEERSWRALARLHALLATLGRPMFDPAIHPDIKHPPLSAEHRALIAKNADNASVPKAPRAPERARINQEKES